jgi:uncharacterized MAPEG superfamily protein
VRAYGAHLNGLETSPWFASAAHTVGGPSRIADILAVVDILLRMGHMADASAAFTAAQFVALPIVISPLFR